MSTKKENKKFQAELTIKDSIVLTLLEEDIERNRHRLKRYIVEKLAQIILEESDEEITSKFQISLSDKTEKQTDNEHSFISKLSAIHFENIPEIFNSLLEKSTKDLMDFVCKAKHKEKEEVVNRTASGKYLPIEKSPVLSREKKAFQEESDEHREKEEKNKSAEEDNLHFNFDFKLNTPNKQSKWNHPENKEGHLLDLLICDNFKESYESTLSKTSLPEDSLSTCEHISKNYKVSVLFGNISYSIGLYDKSIQFYDRALEIIESDIKSENEVIHLMHIALLLNNIGKSFVNLLKINEGLNYLLMGADNIKRIENLYNNYHNKENFSHQFFLLKINILFNLSESYYCIENYERAQFFIGGAEEIIKSQIRFFSERENVRILARYYNNLGKIQMKTNNYSALENFNKCLEILLGSKKELEKENSILLSDLYNNISIIHINLLDNEKALYNINKSLEIRKNIYGEEDLKTIITYINLGYIYQSMKQNKNALETLQQALKISETNKDIEEIFDAVLLRALGQCYFALGNEIKGLANYSKANIIYKKYYQEKLISLSEVNIVIQNLYGIIAI